MESKSNSKEMKNENTKKGGRKSALKAVAICVLSILCAVLLLLTVNSFLSIFVKHYYPTFGGYRLFSVTTDVMEGSGGDCIAKGNLIVGRVPENADDIDVGTVITFEVVQENSFVLKTNRVIEVQFDEVSQTYSYTARGDNETVNDNIHLVYDDIVGIFTGKQCKILGYVLEYLQSLIGAILLLVVFLLILTLIVFIAVKNKKRSNLNEVNNKKNVSVTSEVSVSESDFEDEEIITVQKVLGGTEIEGDDNFTESSALDEDAISLVDDIVVNSEEPVLNNERAVTIEEILNEAEEVPEDEAPDVEILPDEEEPQEEVRSVNNVTGMAIIARYKKSFTAKLIQSDDKTKVYYSILKNELLSYSKVKNRISWNHENFNNGRTNIARFSVRGKTLCLYFALDPNDYLDTKYRVEYAQSKKYENIACLYRVKNARRVKYALELIAALAEKFGLEKGEQQSINYYVPYEPTKPLVERGLIKELVSEEDYAEFMRQYSRKEVDRNRRSFVSAKEVNAVITDEVAIALVEDKRENKVKASGKKDIINVDVLSENFDTNETVNLESLKRKGLIGKNVVSVKVLARGVLTKSLTVEAQDFSIEAVKMIVLTGGKATKV